MLFITKSDLKSLHFAVTRFLMKLSRTSNTEIIAECQHDDDDDDDDDD